jgi:hypothetical protein
MRAIRAAKRTAQKAVKLEFESILKVLSNTQIAELSPLRLQYFRAAVAFTKRSFQS